MHDFEALELMRNRPEQFLFDESFSFENRDSDRRWIVFLVIPSENFQR